MKQIVLMQATSGHKSFYEGLDGVTWLAERPNGVQVRMDSGTIYLVPWSNIAIVEE